MEREKNPGMEREKNHQFPKWKWWKIIKKKNINALIGLSSRQSPIKWTTYASKLDRAFGLQSWSVVWRWRKQKFNLHCPHCTGISSFFLHPLNVHLLVKIFVLSDLHIKSKCWPTVMSGDTPRGVGTGSPHNGHAGTCTSFLWADVHLWFW